MASVVAGRHSVAGIESKITNLLCIVLLYFKRLKRDKKETGHGLLTANIQKEGECISVTV